jgi:hypothetical protein
LDERNWVKVTTVAGLALVVGAPCFGM